MPLDSSTRPDPDALLARLDAEARLAARGKLKIFFGASPGVGKTFAMLASARVLAANGIDVLVGVVETHGRGETQAMVEGLPLLPRREVEYRGHRLQEFDIDAALARAPALILMDELAHSNAPGSRHPKRWQDIEELLAAGIDVFTTVNVQHIESLSDIVGGITGVRVWETVPDHVFDRADEVVLVDLPPAELLQRLREGKVYIPQQAERAMSNFFRKGNLLALRELALRRTADRVDDDVRAYRREKSVTAVWPTRDALLVCVGGQGGEKLVRSAARLAAQLEVPWHAVNVETPAMQRAPEAERMQVLRALRLAQELGAQTASLTGHDAAGAAVAYAREHNLGKLLVGRSRPSLLAFLRRRGLTAKIGQLAGDLDVIEVAIPDDSDADAAAHLAAWRAGIEGSWRGKWRQYAWTAAGVALVTALATPLLEFIELTNIVMLFLLAVAVSALCFGRGPAVLAAFLSVAAFDFFFVPPRLTFAVSDVEYFVTFAVMLVVGLLIGQLTARLRFEASAAQAREHRTRILYETARELSAALTVEEVESAGERFARQGMAAQAALLLPDDDGRIQQGGEAAGAAAAGGSAFADTAIAQWAYDHGEPAGRATGTLPSSPLLYVPLRAPMRTRGVLALRPADEEDRSWAVAPEQQRLLDTGASLIATALERVHYIAVAQDALVDMESERLRNSLLAALSHDLRTPLTALVGLADTLVLTPAREEALQAELAHSIRDEALRTSALVNNLLDMARLQSGKVALRREWQSLEETVGGALKSRTGALAGHAIRVSLPEDLPLVEFDAVLMERVLTNLLENAAKYTPPGSIIEIGAEALPERLRVWVADNGPGLPPGRAERLFGKFTRGHEESAIPGVGLGLAIVRAIVETHGGSVRAENVTDAQENGGGDTQGAMRGARFVFELPRREAPQLPEESPQEPS
ncbi:MAG: two-component system sensor histidine kinase KdpD [Moraxellaceae bacterium]|nr:two-component system sensor histidine kinase KdpD [Moraxellaceae bacterium]